MFVTAYFNQLIEFASAHAWLAYLTVFLAALLEAVPLFGSLIPGSTIIMALSALIPGGQLDLVEVLAVAVSGAMLGDGIAFWIGHVQQHRILDAWPMSRYPTVVARSEAFFLRFGAWAVLFARFVPPIRAFVPITAGALKMQPARFFAVNIPAILLWAPAHILPGAIAASTLEKSSSATLHFWLPVVAGAAATIALAVWVARRWRKHAAEMTGIGA